MNYRHIYHAGNFADVFKHMLLVKLLEKLRVKETPFCVLDTHAGIGLYDLASIEAEKTGEYKQGIERLLTGQVSEHFTLYRDIICSFNSGAFRYYPGSPCIARELLRPQDRLVLAELHPEDSQQLKNYFRRDNAVMVHHKDAYLSMKAFLPPKEKRGLVLIDPPFEQENEFGQMIDALQMAKERFHHGIYALWYPIKTRLPVQYFHNSLLALGFPKILVLELLLQPDTTQETLNGCGMVILNSPWKLDSEAALWLPELAGLLGGEESSVRVEWLRD